VTGDTAGAVAEARHGDELIIEVENLTVSFGTRAGSLVRAVEDVTLGVHDRDIYALVGESGCGKSTLAYSLLNIVPPPGRITRGDVRFRGRSVVGMSERELRSLRAAEVAMVFQASMNAFNPVIKIGKQVEHVLDAHPEVYPDREAGREYFYNLLEMVRLPPARIWQSFESQLSGGMKQRTAIAMALLLKPAVVVLDEPTTALDVLSQRLVIDILHELHSELGLTIIFVTHDLAVVAELATRVAVLYAGRLVECGSVYEIFGEGRRHPYVQGLINAIPSVLDKGLQIRPIPGEVPNLAQLPRGCRFAPRCPLVEEGCLLEEPSGVVGESGHMVACHVVNRSREVLVG